MALRRQPAILNPQILVTHVAGQGFSPNPVWHSESWLCLAALTRIDDGGREFRGTDATLKLNRGGFSVYREGVPAKNNPVVRADSFEDGTISHMQNFFDCIKSRKEPNAPVETRIAAARAGHIVNLAYHRGGQITWPPKSPA